MRRLMIIGAGGAGKSTLARRVGERTGLPVVHLDALYWHPGWVPTPTAEWEARVRALVAEEAWVMDGNYGGTMDIRLARADTVVFLDLPRLTSTLRIVWRSLRFRGRTRPDMTPGCPERLTPEFVRWVWDYGRTRRPGILARLAALPPDRRVVILRSAAEVERWLASLGPAGDRTRR